MRPRGSMAVLIGALALLAAPAAAQAGPVVVRVAWIDFPEPDLRPRVLAWLETAPVASGAAFSARLDWPAPRDGPSSWRVLERELAGRWAQRGPARYGLQLGLAPGLPLASFSLPPRVLELPVRRGFLGQRELRVRASLQGQLDLLDDGAVALSGSCDLEAPQGVREVQFSRTGGSSWGGRGDPVWFGPHLPRAFLAVLPADEALRRPAADLASWQAHAVEALGGRAGLVFLDLARPPGGPSQRNPDPEHALGFLQFVPTPSAAARAALARYPIPADSIGLLKVAQAAADDPVGVEVPGPWITRGPPFEELYYRKVALHTRSDPVLGRALHALGADVVFGDARLEARLDELDRVPGELGSRRAPRPWNLWTRFAAAAYLLGWAWAARVALRGAGDRAGRPLEDSIPWLRRRLLAGGLLVAVDVVSRGFDLLPDPVGYVALLSAARVLARAPLEGTRPLPRWGLPALLWGATAAVAVDLFEAPTPARRLIEVAAWIGGIAWGLALCRALAVVLVAQGREHAALACRTLGWVGAAVYGGGAVFELLGLEVPGVTLTPAAGSGVDYGLAELAQMGALLPLLLPALLFILIRHLDAAELIRAARARALDRVPALEREGLAPDPQP